MKILEITPNFPGEVFINRHVESLYLRGFPVEVLTRRPLERTFKSASVQAQLPTSIQPKYFPKIGYLSVKDLSIAVKQVFSPSVYPLTKTSLRDQVYLDYISHLNPDLVHFHFGSSAASYSWIPRQLEIPYSLSLRGTDIQVNPLKSNDYTERFKVALNNASGIHTVCNDLWKMAELYLDREIFHRTIYTTVPLPNELPRIRLNKNEPIFLTVGRFHWRKNLIALLNSFKKVLDTSPDAKLVIIGDGPEKESLLYWISILGLKDRVILKGKMVHDQIYEIMRDSSAYIQSSIAEGFSNATAEAMAMGLPVFATKIGGTGEIIKDGVTGFLLDPFEPHQWYKKITLVRDLKLMEKISENAWQMAKEKFAREIHAEKFIHFFKHVLKVNAQIDD